MSSLPIGPRLDAASLLTSPVGGASGGALSGIGGANAGGAGRVSFDGLANGDRSASLRAESEPQARGLSAAQHADRVLEQLVEPA